jgi:hypothetical protein
VARGDTLIGERLGQYRITGILGRGGMATVYRATQERLGRDVALKVLRAAPDDPQATARFEREARSVARLSHPNILPVYDYGEEHGARYIAAQLIEGGRSLASRRAEGPVTPAEAVALAAPVLDALDYAHRQGVIHRDIKPANILLPRPDWPLLGDFGIAQSLAEQTQLTGAGEIIGTPAYMAPERASGLPADGRADLYAMGVVLYELLTGAPPFAGEPMAVLIQHIRDEPAPPSALSPGVPPALERAILRAMAKDPADRFQSAAEMAAALRAAVAPPAPAPVETRAQPRPAGPLPAPAPAAVAPPAPATRPVASRADAPPIGRPAARRRPLRALALVAGLIALLTAGALLWSGGGGGADLPITLGEEAWSGGYRGPFNGGPTYGGRTAVVAYGQGSDQSAISATFELAAAPRGEVELTVEGMDSEGAQKTEIVIAVNGQTIYNGPNPLPDDDRNFDTGTWASHRFPFDPRLLRAGTNTVTISNRSPGRFSSPPFIIIDSATIE